MDVQLQDIDLGVIELFRAGVPLEKKRRKRILDFFKYLSGGESPLEAVELTLRRSRKLQEAQLKTLYEIMKMVENPPDALKNDSPNTKATVDVLFSCNLLNLLLRVLKIRLSDDCTANGEEAWKAIYHHCLVILKNVLGFNQYTQLHLKKIMENETVEDVLEFCDDSVDVLACFPAVATLKNLCLYNREACERIVFSNGLPKLAQLFLKDNSQKMIFKAHRNGLKQYQKKILEEHIEEALEHFKSPLDCHSEIYSLNIMRSWSYKMQMDAANIILKISDQNDRCRKIVFKDKMTFKALMKWVKSPAISANDCSMIEICTKIIGMLCLNEELCWQMIDSFSIITHLENGINIAEWTSLSGFLEVALRVSAHSGRCRSRLIESKDILCVLARYIFSYHKELQDTTLRILVNLAECGTTAKNLIHCGIIPRSIFLLESFYQQHANRQAQLLSKILSKNCEREWKRFDVAFECERQGFFSRLDEENAQLLKVKGNENFKIGLFNEAAQLYSEALQCASPGLNASKAGKDHSRWWVLPAVLYSNRAQCHLNNRDWESALSDCHEAMARCFEDNEEAKKILIKTSFRRSKAFLGLGSYYRSLNDIAFCLRNSLNGRDVQVQYWEIMMKYRAQFGPEPIRRCGNCMGGEGDKLKRCANCEEVYCSRPCQAEAWELGHKMFCK